jgi:hypothetical protein
MIISGYFIMENSKYIVETYFDHSSSPPIVTTATTKNYPKIKCRRNFRLIIFNHAEKLTEVIFP